MSQSTPDAAPSASQPSDRPRWFRRHPRAALLLFTLVLVLGLLKGADALLGLKDPNKEPDKVPISTRSIRLKEHKPLMDITARPSDEYMKTVDGLVQKAYRFRADENAFVMPSMVHQRADATIVFLGGSTTECIYVDEELRFAYLAGRRLEEATGLKINSCNGGVSGNVTLHSVNILLNKVVPLGPRAVAMMHNVNDLVTLLYMGTYWSDHFSRSLITVGPDGDPRRSFSQKLRCMGYDFCDAFVPNLTRRIQSLGVRAGGGWDEWSQVRGRKIDYDAAALAAQFERSLRAFVALCRVYDIQPVLMTMSSRLTDKPDAIVLDGVAQVFGTRDGYAGFKAGFDRFNQTIRDVGRSENVPVIDLAAKIPQDNRHMYDAVHFNDHGSTVAAGIIAKEMAPLLKGPASRPAGRE